MNLTAQKDNGCKTFQRCDENVTNFQQSSKKKKKEFRCSTTTLRRKFIVTPGNESYKLTYTGCILASPSVGPIRQGFSTLRMR